MGKAVDLERERQRRARAEMPRVRRENLQGLCAYQSGMCGICFEELPHADALIGNVRRGDGRG